MTAATDVAAPGAPTARTSGPLGVVRRLFLTGGAGRLVGVDVARCIALLGMMSTHIYDATTSEGWPTLSHALFGGRASALFAVLAGVSLALVTGGHQPHRGARLAGDSAGLLVRSVVIAVIGFWLGGLETTVAIILVYYAVLFVVAIPFLRLRSAALTVLAVLWMALGPVASHHLRSDGIPRDYAVPSFASLDGMGALLRNLLLDGYYPVLSWVPYILLGLAVGRLDLRRLSTLGWLGIVGGVAAVGAKMASTMLLADSGVREQLIATTEDYSVTNWTAVEMLVANGQFGTTPTGSWWWLATAGPHSGTPLDLLHTSGTALFALAVCLLLTRVGARFWQIVFGAGAMTLTLYSAHIVMQSGAFGPGSDGADAYWRQVAIVVATGAVFAAVRLRGPLEIVVRAASTSTAWVVRSALGAQPRPR